VADGISGYAGKKSPLIGRIASLSRWKMNAKNEQFPWAIRLFGFAARERRNYPSGTANPIISIRISVNRLMNSWLSISRKALSKTGACLCVTSVLLAAADASGAAAGEAPNLLASPDGRIQVLLQMPAAGSGERPRWSASFRAQPILTGCGLGLATADAGELMVGARVLNEHRRSSACFPLGSLHRNSRSCPQPAKKLCAFPFFHFGLRTSDFGFPAHAS
jgi:hypothetical protein